MQSSVLARPVVLFVEDEPLVLEVMAIELQDAGFEVIRTRTGEEAANALDNIGRVDLVFTDLRLPGTLDGWDVAQRARRRDPHVPVIYATGQRESDPRRVSGALFMNKPYRLSEFLEAARELGVATAVTLF